MAKLSPVFNDQTIDENGDPYVGAKLFTYTAGSSTKQAVYTDAAGTVPHSNPIILDSLGFPTQGAIWIPEGISVKFVIAPPTDTDPPTSPIKTIDNVQGVNDASVSVSEWQASGVVPTYISAVSFSLPGDQTTGFQKGRRAQFTTSGGTKYGKIINSVFTTLTTVTMLMDGTDVLDAGLSVVNLSLLHATPSALPNPIELLRSAVVGNATTTPTWDYAYGEVQDVSGVITYTAIPNAPRPGATRIWYPAAGAIMTHGGNISVQGNASVTAAAGDKWIITAVTTTTFDVEVIKKDGVAVSAIIPKHLSGLQIRTAGSSTTISVSAGYAANSDDTVMMRLAAAINKTTAAWAVGTGNGGLDTGAIANNTAYHLFEIMRPDTGVVDVTFSLSPTAPTLQAEYTKFRRIGAWFTNGSGQWDTMEQDGDRFIKTGGVTLDVLATNPGTAAVLRTLPVPTGIKVIALMNAGVARGTSNSTSLYISDPATLDQAPSETAAPLTTTPGDTGSPSFAGSVSIQVRTNTSGQVRTRLSTSVSETVLRISLLGWIDTRGRDQ